MLPPRAMFLTTDTDIMPTVTITERDPLRLRLTQRPTPPSSMVLTVTHTVSLKQHLSHNIHPNKTN